MTGLIAIVIIITTGLLLWAAMSYVTPPTFAAGSDAALRTAITEAHTAAFRDAKDLLLILTPFVATVLAFYFTRTITAGQVESATTTARVATEGQVMANRAAESAIVNAATATAQVQAGQAELAVVRTEHQAKDSALRNLATSSGALLSSMGGSGAEAGIVGGNPTPPTVDPQAVAALQAALAEARRALGTP